MNYICLSVETTPKLHFNSFWKSPCIIYFQKCYIIKNIPCRWYHAVLMVWLTLTQHRWMFLWLKQKAWNKGTYIPAVSVSHVMTARRQIKSGSLCKQSRKAWIREKVFQKCAAGLCRVRFLLPCPCRLWNSTRFFMLVASANFCVLPPPQALPLALEPGSCWNSVSSPVPGQATAAGMCCSPRALVLRSNFCWSWTVALVV